MQPASDNSDIYYALAAIAMWSTVAVAFKLGLSLVTPMQLVTVAVAIATVFFSTLVLVTGRLANANFMASLGQGAGTISAALGMLNPLAYYLVLFAAYDRLPAQIAQPLNFTWSITLALLAVPLLGQRLTRQRLIGIGVSYLGVLIILAPWQAQASVSWAGVFLALLSTLIWAIYWLLNARSKVDPLLSLTVGFWVACPILIITCLFTDGWPQLSWPAFSYAAWVGLVEMALGFLCWQSAMRRTKRAALLGQLIFLSPFVSLWLIHNVLQEHVSGYSIIGLIVIVAGLLISTRETPKLRPA